MDILESIQLFRDNIYRGESLDNSIMNNILQFIEKKLSDNRLSTEHKTKLNNYMNMCIDALSNKDYIYLADILYFEMSTLIKEY